jgi:phenylacetate-CoA ligase
MAARDEWLALLRRSMLHPTAPADDRYWAPALETCSRAELRAIQGEKLALAVRFLYENSRFYRDRLDARRLRPADVRSVDDLGKLPLTTKQEMVADQAAHPPWGTYTAVDDAAWSHGGWLMFTSSGTTAQPRPFRYTLVDRDQWAWADARALWAMGVRPGDRALIAFGYGPHVFLWGLHYALHVLGVPIIPGGGLDTRARARAIATYAPTVLACTPSYALYLGSVMRELGEDPAASAVRLIACGGEPGSGVPATRARIQALWGAELHEFYGCTEASPSAGGYTCAAEVQQTARPATRRPLPTDLPAASLLPAATPLPVATPLPAVSPLPPASHQPVATHLMEDIQIWETVHPETLEPVAPGERGLTVCTNLCSEASPQLRFLVGDYTTLDESRCACGRTHVRARGGFQGRADDLLSVRGLSLFPSAIEDAVRSAADVGDEFQIVVDRERDLDVLTIVAEPAPDVPEAAWPVVAAAVEAEVRARCELRPRVEVRPPGTLPKTEFKARRVVDRRAPGSSETR